MDLKQEAARNALDLICNNTTVGLGAGSTIAFLVDFLKPKTEAGLELNFVTSSYSTLQLLSQKKLRVQPIAAFKTIDIYFDGCDQLDKELNALKSGGGIHTQEKLLASMADQFVLLGDEAKLVDHFDHRFPVVIEALPQSILYVPAAIERLFPNSKSNYRISSNKDGLVITENGNYLLDVWLNEWPEISKVNTLFKSITGIVETSLFYGLANKAIIAGKKWVKILDRQV